MFLVVGGFLVGFLGFGFDVSLLQEDGLLLLVLVQLVDAGLVAVSDRAVVVAVAAQAALEAINDDLSALLEVSHIIRARCPPSQRGRRRRAPDHPCHGGGGMTGAAQEQPV